MTEWNDWFRSQLKASGDAFAWAFSQLDSERQYRLPPYEKYMGSWSAARHLWHVTEYERCLALPSMQQWLGGSRPADDSWIDNDEAWSAVQSRSADELVAAFCSIRDQQIALLDKLQPTDWAIERDTIWGLKPLTMVATKTYQHTLEHCDTILKMGLWWDEFE